MAQTHDFEGSTHHFGPPSDMDAKAGWLHIYASENCNVSAWKPTAEELAKLNAGESIFLSVRSGRRMVQVGVDEVSRQAIMCNMPVVVPVFVGCEAEMVEVLRNAGEETWKD